jgi:hypothetical protein
MSVIIYLDESGDLGWKFDVPYRKGGSSRYLTIGAVCVPSEKKHLPKRVVKRLYAKFGWRKDTEIKWSDMKPGERTHFARLAKEMCDKNKDIFMHGIVVQKVNVMEHIRADSNKLYNYMIKLSLLDRMAQHDVVTLVPDPRSIKVMSGNSLPDYLQTELWFTKKATTNIVTHRVNSKDSLGIQFADMLSGLVQSRFEDNESSNFQILAPKLVLSRLFFS